MADCHTCSLQWTHFHLEKWEAIIKMFHFALEFNTKKEPKTTVTSHTYISLAALVWCDRTHEVDV